MATNPFERTSPARGSYGFTGPGQPAAPATSPANPFQGPTASVQGGAAGYQGTNVTPPSRTPWSDYAPGSDAPVPQLGEFELGKHVVDYVGTTPEDYAAGQDSAPIEPLAIEPYQIPDWLVEARGEVLDFWGERMDPDYTMWSPEARAAADRRVGSMLAISERDIGAGMAARGLGNSGIRDQLMRDANVKAAVGMGDISAQFSEADALQQAEAARMVEDMRRWSSVADWDQYVQYAGVGPMYADAVGDYLREGPETETFDYAQYGATAEGYRQWQEALDAMIEEGKMGLDDLLLTAVQTFISLPGVGWGG